MKLRKTHLRQDAERLDDPLGDVDIREKFKRSGSTRVKVIGSVAVAVAIALGIGYAHRQKSEMRRMAQREPPAISAPAQIIEPEIPALKPPEPAPKQEIAPEVLSYLDAQSERLGKKISAVFPESKYGFGEIIRAPNSRIKRETEGAFKGALVLETGRAFSGRNTSDSSILGDNPSDCSERAWSSVPWLANQLWDNLVSVSAKPVYLPRNYAGEDGIQEHWINTATISVSNRNYTISFDSTPLNRNAGPGLHAARESDPDEEMHFTKREGSERGAVYSERSEEKLTEEGLRQMFNSTKKALPISLGYQPMSVVDAKGPGKMLVEAGITEDAASLTYLFQTSHFIPGDSDKPPEFGSNYWAKVAIPKKSLARAQDALKAANPSQALNVLREGGFDVKGSKTEGLDDGMRKAVSGNMDLLHHLIMKTKLD